MMEDPFATAFQHMAEERRKTTIEEAIQKLREAYEDLEAEDGGTPDVMFILANGTTVCTIGNGITDERALWLLKSVEHDMFCGEA